LKKNFLRFADRAGVSNASKTDILLLNNIIVGNVEIDYLEFDTRINLDEIKIQAMRATALRSILCLPVQ